MHPIFDQGGREVAWRDGYLLFDTAHNPDGHIQSGYVFSCLGQHVAQFVDGFFWDLEGCAFAFEKGATGHLSLPPVPTIRLESVCIVGDNLPTLPQFPLGLIDTWSSSSWSNVLRGDANVS